MSLEQFANNASTTLGSAVSNVATTITVATGSGALFPAISGGQFFHATMFSAGSSTGLPNEIVKVTARAGDTMTVVRGQEGTSASAWSVGDTFANFPTAEFFNGVVQESDVQSQVGNAGVDTGAANEGVVVLVPAITNLSQILYSPIRILKTNSANTSSYQLIVNGLMAENVTLNGQALVAGQLAASQIFEVAWDGSNFELLSNPAVTENNGLAQMAANTVKANLTGSAANPSDVTLASLLAALGGVGINQTWQNVTPARTSGVLYTNTTPFPITAMVVFPDTEGDTAVYSVVVGGVTLVNNMIWDSGNQTATATATFVVPAGATYKVTWTPGLVFNSPGYVQWNELRS